MSLHKRNTLKFLILDRYILFEFIKAFIGSSILFVMIILLFSMIREVGYFLQHNVKFITVFELYFYKSFLMFTSVAPACCLFAAVFSINKLAKNNELMAIINSGMSIYRLTASTIIFGFIFSIALVYVNDWVVFPSERKSKYLSDVIRRRHYKSRKNQHDLKIWGSNKLFFKAVSYNHARRELKKLIILKRREKDPKSKITEYQSKLLLQKKISEFTNERKLIKKTNQTISNETQPVTNQPVTNQSLSNRIFLKKTNIIMPTFDADFLKDIRTIQDKEVWLFRIDAESARYDKNKKGWYLYNGRIRKYLNKREIIISFKKRFFPLKEKPYDFSRDWVNVHSMTTEEARNYIQKLKKAGKPHRKELVEYYLKYSFPMISFVILIIGISFGGFSPKSVIVLSFFISVCIYLIYYTFVAFGLSLSKTGIMHPALGAWMGNIVFFTIGIFLLIFRKT